MSNSGYLSLNSKLEKLLENKIREMLQIESEITQILDN